MNFPGIETFTYYISQLSIPDLRWTDLVEILIIAYLIYRILLWIKNTRAWQLMKGILVVLVIALLAAFFNMTTILWIFQHFAGIAVTALVIILQPELRKAMEELGRKNIVSSLLGMEPVKTEEGRFSDRTVNELVRACTEMGRVHTGALIVIEQMTPLVEYERSGIEIDGVVSSQLLINIFEKNTPLHDGAVIIRGNRVVSATAYLPLSSTVLDKNLGTRHRAGLGVSEETDALTLIVSEETGYVSYTYKGRLWNNVKPEELRAALARLQNKLSQEETRTSPLFSLNDIRRGAFKRKKAGPESSKKAAEAGLQKKVEAERPEEEGKKKEEGKGSSNPVKAEKEGGAHA